MINATTTTAQISISVDGIWAGSGKIENGQIVDCAAQFCSDTDESEEIYELIEQAIAEGKGSVTVEYSDDDKSRRITWSIT